MNNILSVQTYNIRNIFWQLVNKTTDRFNNIVFILVAKISFKKVCEKMENNSALLVCNRNVDLLRLVGATLDSKIAFLRKMRKKNLIILKNLQKKILPVFILFVCRCWHLSWKCSENCNMVTERPYDSVVFKICLNIITICLFIEQ